MTEHQHGAVGGFEWWETPAGWLVRHYLDNGVVLGTRYETKEQAVAKAYEAAAEVAQLRAEVEPPRIRRITRSWKLLTREQSLQRDNRALMWRIAGLSLDGVAKHIGRPTQLVTVSRERVRQVIAKARRKNHWLIVRRKVTLDSYLFKRHGFGGRQYRLGA